MTPLLLFVAEAEEEDEEEEDEEEEECRRLRVGDGVCLRLLVGGAVYRLLLVLCRLLLVGGAVYRLLLVGERLLLRVPVAMLVESNPREDRFGKPSMGTFAPYIVASDVWSSVLDDFERVSQEPFSTLGEPPRQMTSSVCTTCTFRAMARRYRSFIWRTTAFTWLILRSRESMTFIFLSLSSFFFSRG
jgi:hypothetical protein